MRTKENELKRFLAFFIAIVLIVGYLIGGIIAFTAVSSQSGVVERETIELVAVECEGSPGPELESFGIFTTTAYCACSVCCGIWAENRPVDENGNPIIYTASGTVATEGRTIAVDPSVFPYGSEIIIDGHTYIAEDCGGAIKGNRLDIYFESHEAALAYGVQEVEVFVVRGGECT